MTRFNPNGEFAPCNIPSLAGLMLSNFFTKMSLDRHVKYHDWILYFNYTKHNKYTKF